MRTQQVSCVRTDKTATSRTKAVGRDIPGVPSSHVTRLFVRRSFSSNTRGRVKTVQATVVAKEKIRH